MWRAISKLSFLLLVVPQLVSAQIVDRNKNSFLKALPRNSCKVYEEHRVSNPPLARDQASLNFCYGFAATYLLDHHICTTEKRKCGDPATSLSVLDVMKNTTNQIAELGDGYSVLAELSGKKGIATEACAPYSNLTSKVNNDWSGNGQAFRNLENIYKTAKKNTGCTSVGAVSSVSNLQVSGSEFEEAIREPEFKNFLGKLAVPSECAKNGLAIPSFQIDSIRSDVPFFKAEHAVNNALQFQIRKDNPILFSFCTELDCSEGHATVIHGYRENCCKGKLGEEKCSTEYLVYDSARVFGQKPGDYWLPAENVFKRADFLRERGQIKSDGPEVFGAFIFISR